MAYSVNQRPLLGLENDSEFDDDIEPDFDNATVSIQDKKLLLNNQPKDRFNFAYIVFYLLGINTMVPWNFFMTANDYWMYKFREIHENNTGHDHYSHMEIMANKTELQASFTSYLNVASAVPSLCFLILNAFLCDWISMKTRMITSQLMILLLFLLTTSFVKINTDKWQDDFLIITLVTVAIVSALSSIFGGTLFGIVGRFSPKYITAMSGGQALSGIVTTIVAITSIWIGASPVISGLVYFAIGDVVILCSFIAYLFLDKQEFFKYHMKEDMCIQQPNFSLNNEVSFVEGHRVSFKKILIKIWPYGFSMFMVFFVSMSVYPAVTVLVESQDKGKHNPWNDVYFVPVVTFLVFSCGDYAGRLLSGFFLWPKRKPWLVVLLSILRILFIPAFLFCNVQPRKNLPVYITSDIYYIILTVLFAIGNGYLCNISFVLAPTMVEQQDQEVAAAMMGAFLGLGLTFGSAISLIFVKII
ncbi:equilibrative nucleoside transporter 3-like [Aphidius gifuensis]|nr:equilibrative nucleoside transporter 3-like [Aphidius gifuensis]